MNAETLERAAVRHFTRVSSVFYPQLYECPSAQAFLYLPDLDLGPFRPKAGAQVLGQLEFMECPFMCNNSDLVTVPDLATVSCLQQRLLTLNIQAQIEPADY